LWIAASSIPAVSSPFAAIPPVLTKRSPVICVNGRAWYVAPSASRVFWRCWKLAPMCSRVEPSVGE
jgi:hypothetical protein